MAKKEKKRNVKQQAYEKKQEQKGTNVVLWIMGCLIVLGLIYAVWASFLVA